ncbi:SPOSA6832_03466, partial [Sporobolomyces salmonicolor]
MRYRPCVQVGVATGQHSFAHEQAVLVGENFPEFVFVSTCLSVCQRYLTVASSVCRIIQGGSSQVDILIATPGRLMDHLKATKGFSLQHLRFFARLPNRFVVDEADRLLTQSFHDWLPTILAALKPSPTLSSESPTGTVDLPEQADALAPVWWDAEGKPGRVASDVDERCAPSCQKLLFSATLSRDPAKIDALHLHRPIYISVEDALDPHAEDEAMDSELKFTFPAELTEHMIISPSSHKPLYLFHLLHTLSISSALCFTKSVEAATRLAKLVEFFEEARRAETGEGSEDKRVVVKAYSSELAPNERKKVLKEFKQGEIQMLICSDLISRGIDIANVSHVISYDIPTDMRKYVHRVGRTARAGHTGEAWSLVEDQEVAPFKAIMSSAQHWQKIDRVRVKDNLVEPFVPPYQVRFCRTGAAAAALLN